ncbi:hypothetical protein B0H17DRAFT_1215698 [Mycena rosella]|uniref:Uncharacterized protein n=1 Tax=Mycena rosella TaxID=1033263 RepID=A0AAD7FZX3_MYCRO|nr:hypothetical protein B0H17DRAFT_1215698 [Mycena rosella]
MRLLTFVALPLAFIAESSMMVQAFPTPATVGASTSVNRTNPDSAQCLASGSYCQYYWQCCDYYCVTHQQPGPAPYCF